jgi:hypothetical protein
LQYTLFHNIILRTGEDDKNPGSISSDTVAERLHRGGRLQPGAEGHEVSHDAEEYKLSKIEGFLINTSYCKDDIGHLEKQAAIFTQFTDYILTENAS